MARWRGRTGDMYLGVICLWLSFFFLYARLCLRVCTFDLGGGGGGGDLGAPRSQGSSQGEDESLNKLILPL
jgi:hypothetical protein